MPVEYPTNALTRLIEGTASQNQSGVRHSGVASATPVPSVRSADLGRPVEEDTPLSLEERQELDRLAQEAGIKDERLAQDESLGGQYGTFEEALAAGAAADLEPVYTASALAHRENYAEATAQARARMNRRAEPQAPPRLPDFRNVEGIDLLRNVVMVDGMEFAITDEDARVFRQFVVETAHAQITERLNEAMSLFTSVATPEDTDGAEGSEG